MNIGKFEKDGKDEYLGYKDGKYLVRFIEISTGIASVMVKGLFNRLYTKKSITSSEEIRNGKLLQDIRRRKAESKKGRSKNLRSKV